MAVVVAQLANWSLLTIDVRGSKERLFICKTIY